MNLEEAIELLKTVRGNEYVATSDYENALDTVLKALDDRYQKGYQDGFKQAKFDCEMDKLQEPSERTIRIKDEYLQLIDFLLIDYDGCKSVETLKELIDETRDYIHKALKNDDKSVITVNSKKKFNILGEEVE